jgi:hypothetical protein
MTTPADPFFQAGEKIFLDLTAVNLVRFEGEGNALSAQLKFKGGGSDTVRGQAAHILRQQLTNTESKSSLVELVDAPNTLNSMMETLGDREHWHILNHFYPSFQNLILRVPKVTRESIRHVQRFLSEIAN